MQRWITRKLKIVRLSGFESTVEPLSSTVIYLVAHMSRLFSYVALSKKKREKPLRIQVWKKAFPLLGIHWEYIWEYMGIHVFPGPLGIHGNTLMGIHRDSTVKVLNVHGIHSYMAYNIFICHRPCTCTFYCFQVHVYPVPNLCGMFFCN